MNLILEIKFKNHFRAVPFMVVNIILSFLAVWYFRFDQTSILLFTIYLVIITLPTIVVHLEYYSNDQDKTIELSENEIKIHYKRGSHNVILKTSDIDKITIYRSANFNKIPMLPTEFYFYAKVFAHPGNESIIITSLMLSNSCDELKILKNIPVEFKGTFLASPNVTIT